MRIFYCFCIFFLAACNRAESVQGTFIDAQQKVLHQALLEVVKDSGGRAKGLMFRKELDRASGMIFVFPESAQRSFWMKNTYVSLDMLFISSNLEVLGIIENVPILNEVSRSLPVQSQYVVELPAGSCKLFGIAVGTKLQLSKSLSALS